MGVAEKTPAIRAFVAIELDQMSTRRVARLADGARMASGAPSAVWTPAAKIHVTLKFMAELPAAAVGPLAEEFERAWRQRADWPTLGRAARERVLQIVPPDPVAVFGELLKKIAVTSPTR